MSGRSYKRDSKGRFASTGGGGKTSSKRAAPRKRAATPKTSTSSSSGLDAWGRPRMTNFPTGVRHELGTYAPVRWTQPTKKR